MGPKLRYVKKKPGISPSQGYEMGWSYCVDTCVGCCGQDRQDLKFEDCSATATPGPKRIAILLLLQELFENPDI